MRCEKHTQSTNEVARQSKDPARLAAAQISLFRADNGDGYYSRDEIKRAKRSFEQDYQFLVRCGSNIRCLSREVHAAKATQRVRAAINKVKSGETACLDEVHVIKIAPMKINGEIFKPRATIVIPRSKINFTDRSIGSVR